MTAAIALEKGGPDRSEQLEQLRRQMAAVSGKVGARSPVAAVGEPVSAGLPKGTVAVLSGARSLPVSMAASVSAAGGHVAVVGLPDFGLLAAAGMGADLSRLAVIPQPGTDPVEVAAVLMDGMDLVILGLAGRRVPAGRARALVARARQRGCTLLVTQGDWQGASVRMDARVSGYEITSGPGASADSAGAPVAGFGRISAVRVSIRTRGRH
jgi:hypothetical protein